MPRYVRCDNAPASIHDWILEEMNRVYEDEYHAVKDPHSPRYQAQTRYTGGDFRQVRARELDEAPGGICRIDFVTLDDGMVWRGWRAGWYPGDHCQVAKTLEKPLDEAIANLERQGWTVHRWHGGARAWRFGARPVRTGEWLRRARERLAKNPPAGVQVWAHDLLYDL